MMRSRLQLGDAQKRKWLENPIDRMRPPRWDEFGVKLTKWTSAPVDDIFFRFLRKEDQ
jgi:hypothetical protein